jgi:hypothetical protein
LGGEVLASEAGLPDAACPSTGCDAAHCNSTRRTWTRQRLGTPVESRWDKLGSMAHGPYSPAVLERCSTWLFGSPAASKTTRKHEGPLLEHGEERAPPSRGRSTLQQDHLPPAGSNRQAEFSTCAWCPIRSASAVHGGSSSLPTWPAHARPSSADQTLSSSSNSRGLGVAKFRRTWPEPEGPKSGPGESATRA